MFVDFFGYVFKLLVECEIHIDYMDLLYNTIISSFPKPAFLTCQNSLHIITLLSPMGAYVGGQLVSSDRYLDCKPCWLC